MEAPNIAEQQIIIPLEPKSPANRSVRKRICQACDRCRLRKSKYNGCRPCSKCKAENSICVFGERKNSYNRVYPKGYVEMLENQQAQLVTGLQELYKRTQRGQGWIGSPLKETSRGTPLTHDILERLGALEDGRNIHGCAFQEDLNLVQQSLIENGRGFMQPLLPEAGDSEAAHSPILDHIWHNSPSPTDPLVINNFTPNSAKQSPFSPKAKAVPLKAQSYPLLPSNQVTVNPASLQNQSWGQKYDLVDDKTDFGPHVDSPASFNNVGPWFGTIEPFLSIWFPGDDSFNLGLL